jgi:formylglycine-generating enzyme required for sulfatase activity
MNKLLIFVLPALIAVNASAQKDPGNLVLVPGGTFKDSKSNFAGKGVTLPDFYLGKYEVTQKEWTEVMGSNPSQFKGDDLPVESVSWYDCIEYCNKRSEREGLKPYYAIDRDKKDPKNQTIIDDIKWTVTTNAGANGYRLPTEAEWEYAACGGQLGKGATYCGSDDVEKVAWFWTNSGDKPLTGVWSWPVLQQNHNRTKPIGGKAPNELGLFDMSGNVREWCWDWYGDLGADGTAPQGSSAESGRVWKGGGWIGGDFCCTPEFRAGFEASGRGPDQGLRVCRNK